MITDKLLMLVLYLKIFLLVYFHDAAFSVV
jgi:hypothetical protein